jgi:AcrR family transcriptional regulator
MAEAVKRDYDSSRRKAQARLARARVLDAARHRFLGEGYAATTLGAIASDADVSVETVYKAFRNKAGVLKAVFDVAVAGDDEPVAIADRNFVAAIQEEPDARRKLRMYAEHLSRSMPRAAPVQLLARAAAAVDPEIEVVHRQTRTELLAGMSMFAAHLHEGGYLKPGLTVEEARDILWTVNSPEMYELLVLERGWAVARYRDFVADTLGARLLP